jgi:serine/threonine-protein kinase
MIAVTIWGARIHQTALMSVQQPSADDPTAYRTPEETPTVRPAERPLPLDKLTPGATLGDRYRIVSLVGGGGMGEVYRADDLKLGQPVALKFLRRRGGPDAERRLYDEVRLGRQVSHPNVCRLYDIAEVDGQLFITMEFIDGEDLASLLRRIGQLPAAKATAVAGQICAGLGAAHAAGVIHRDLKPANVMLDGRGRVRITDFGVAVAEQSAAKDVGAGTLAYMAPEQLAGNAATTKSDIYALGLVLYEIFTGRRAFAANSLGDLVQQQNSIAIPRPSTITAEIAPAIERTILQCLDPDPDHRPNSVDEVMRQLPGYDPLAAAVAAGETPSPAMVAASEAAPELSPVAAWTLLLFVASGMVAFILPTHRSMFYRRYDLKPPEVLLERAREVVTAVGVSPHGDWSTIYDDSDARVWRTGMYFLYRQSPQPLRPRRADRRVVPNDPPLTVAGMADVLLDASGRLIELTVVPPLHDTSLKAERLDFSKLFTLANIDSDQLKVVRPEWRAPVDSDEKHAWLTNDGQRLEAAAFHAKPVWFSVALSSPRIAAPQQLARNIADITVIFFLILLPAAALLIARRNLNRGRGDRRAAMRFAVFVLVSTATASALRAHHVPIFFEEWLTMSRITADATFWAFMAWIVYICVEPLARRRWPQMLIGWTRVIEGRIRDAIVGRDLLAGAAAGVVVLLVWELTALIGNATLHLRSLPYASPFGSTSYVASFLIGAINEATLRTFGAVTLLLLVTAVVRNVRAAQLVAILFLAASFLFEPAGPLIVRAAYAAVVACVVIFIMFRFGILALSTTAFVVIVGWSVPLTFDPEAWYFGRSVVGIALIAAIALTGFALAVREKSWLPRFAFD